MAQQIINTNKGTADSLKTGATKINSNFTELYTILANNPIAIPSVANNSGKYLTTNGTTISWETVTPTNLTISTLSGVTITSPAAGQVLKYNGVAWINDADATAAGAGSGTVTNVSVTSANGFAGFVATSSSTPAITISTSITGMLKGTGTAITAAVVGTDYQAPISLTTNGSSGTATFSNNILNIPQYTGTGGTVTSASVTSANGFTGTVATASSTPAITIGTSITGVLKGNGTAISAAVAGTDYQAPIGTITGLVKGNGANALTAAVAGTDYQSAQSVTGIVKSSGTTRSAAVLGTDYAPGTSALTTGIVKSTTTTGALSIAIAGTDYQAPIGTITGLVKGNGANALTAAVAGTDYQAPVSATGILKSSGVSGNVTAATSGTDYQAPISLTTNGSSGQATFSNNTLNIPQYTALPVRNSTNATTASLANNAAGNITITGWKSYMLLSIQTSAAAWVTVYTSSAARTADASRTITSDPTPGSGVIAEVITTSATTQIFSPAVLGFSDEVSPSTDIQVKVVNRSGSTAAITITMKLVQLEV